MMGQAPDLDWIREGVTIAEYSGHFRGATVTFKTIERITATQIILTGGVRYSRKTMHQVGSGPYSGPELMSADDPRVVEARSTDRRRMALRGVKDAADAMRTDADAETALAALDAIAAAVATARAAITGTPQADDMARAARVAGEKE